MNEYHCKQSRKPIVLASGLQFRICSMELLVRKIKASFALPHKRVIAF
jgi:hypothetical protein